MGRNRSLRMADLLEEKQRINEAELLDEGKFSNFAKAAALGASLALSPLHAGETHEIEVAELPADLVSSYNELEENPILNFAVAQAMADEMITKVGDEAVSMAPEETEAWGTVKATFEYLMTRDDKIAIAFLGKFNGVAKKLFGNQIRPTLKIESMELPVNVKLFKEAFIKDDSGKVTEEELAQAIVNKVGATGNKYYQDAARYIAAFYANQSLPKNGMIMWGFRDIKSFFAKHDSMDVKSAIGSTRSIMLGNPTTKAEWIEKNKAEIKAERRAEAEARRQAYLNSDEYRRSQDPGWTGPRGTWTLGT